MEFKDFLTWEQASRDTIDFKKIYVDMADDLVCGLLLSEMVYWYLPDKNGDKNKLRVWKKGRQWIAVRRYDWWERARLSPKQADRAIQILIKLDLLEKSIFKFNGEPTTHIRIVETTFLKRFQECLENPSQNPFLPKGEKGNDGDDNNEIDESETSLSTNEASPITENTTSTTTETNLQEDRYSAPADNAAEAVETGLALDAIDKAIATAWGTDSPAKIKELRKTLMGLHPKGSEDYIANVRPAATIEEIIALGHYFDHKNTSGQLHYPTKPAKVQDWFYTVRKFHYGFFWHRNYGIEVPAIIPSDVVGQMKIMEYVKKYYPKVHEEIHQVYEDIKRLGGEAQESILYKPTISLANGHTYQLPINLPYDVYKKMPETGSGWLDVVLEYVQSAHPEAYNMIAEEFGV